MLKSTVFFTALSRKANDTLILYVINLCFDPSSLGIFTSNWYTVKTVSESRKQSAAARNNRVYELLLARQDNFINTESTATNKVSQSISISAQKLPSMRSSTSPFSSSRKQRQPSLGVSSALCFASSMQCQVTGLIKP
jgi:hypothetical protein